MAVLKTRTISRRTVEALKVDKDTVFWDSELSGFGVRVYPSGTKVYVVQTRAGGKAAKRVTVGRHGVVTAEEARRRAALILARIKAGEEPAAEPLAARPAEGPTVADPCRALARRARRGALQAEDGIHVPAYRGQAHPAGAGEDAGAGGSGTPG